MTPTLRDLVTYPMTMNSISTSWMTSAPCLSNYQSIVMKTLLLCSKICLNCLPLHLNSQLATYHHLTPSYSPCENDDTVMEDAVTGNTTAESESKSKSRVFEEPLAPAESLDNSQAAWVPCHGIIKTNQTG